jgi:hypothetical protein
MSDFPHEQPRILAQASADDWAAAIATALLALILLGLLPRVLW